MSEDRDWRQRGECVDRDPEIWFPNGSTKAAQEQEADAKAICWTCEVRPQCLQEALDTRQEFGVWGGMGESERHTARRNTMRRDRRQEARAAHLAAQLEEAS